jgi:tetratricopeptide (TPR) repeat protein
MLLLRKKTDPQLDSDPAETTITKAPPDAATQVDANDVSRDPKAEASSDLRAVVIPGRAPAADKAITAKPANQTVRRLLIPAGINFRGEIEGCDRLVIAGALVGEIKACRHISVLDGGRFEGRAVTSAADIAGSCRGALTVEQKLFVARTGRVSGSVHYGRLEIEEGGALEGDVQRLECDRDNEAITPLTAAMSDQLPPEGRAFAEPIPEDLVADAAARRDAANRAEIERMFAAATAALNASRVDEAESQFKAVIAKSPEHAAALANLGKLARQRGDRAEALSYFAAAGNADPQNVRARCEAATMLHELGRGAEAETIYKSVLESDPKRASALSGLAHLAMERGEKAVALAYFEAAVAADPGDPSIGCDAAHMLRELGRHDDAEAMFKAVIDAYPDHGSALRGLGDLARQRRDRAGALGYFEAAAKADPSNPSVRCDLANILRELSRFGDAEAMFKTVIEGHQDHVGALAGLGHIARQRGELDAAIGYFERAVAADPKNPDLGCELASVLREASRFEEAERSLSAVVEKHPQHAPALAALGHLARQREDRPATLRWFEAAVAADPHDVSIRVEFARALRQKGEFARARQIIEKVLDDEPGAAKA